MILLRKVSSAESAVTGGTTHVRKIYWKGPGTIGDTMTLQDGNGNEQITLVCEVAAQSQIVDFDNEGLAIVGSKVSTLVSGVVYLYG